MVGLYERAGGGSRGGRGTGVERAGSRVAARVNGIWSSATRFLSGVCASFVSETVRCVKSDLLVLLVECPLGRL